MKLAGITEAATGHRLTRGDHATRSGHASAVPGVGAVLS
jgi:hypothetical protein